ncbi:mucin-5AC-like [Scomber scombrus]|uniref:Mucin-5AC-like n=1 Tax=Scomber scombrus TaxID=13677 RepID=A0AAV1PTJ1_SCOSC
MEYHSGGSLPLLGRPRYCPGANANGGYLCETGHCCGETGCCTYYYELWWFWLLWTVLILFSCCCAYRHRRAKLRVQQQQRQREISLLAYHGANSYPSSMLDLSFLASLKLPSYEEVAAQPSTPPPPYSSVFTTPRYPQPPRAADPHLLTQHGPLLHRPLSDGPSSLSSDNSSSCSCDSCCPSSPCSSSLSAPVTYETDTSHASTPSEAAPLTLDVTMETIAAAATCLEAVVPANSGPSLVLSQSPESDLISQVPSDVQASFSPGSGSGVGSRSVPLSSPTPTPASSSPSSLCPAITIESASSFAPTQSPRAGLSPSSPQSLPIHPSLPSPSALTSTSLPAPALLLDPLTALHQSEKGGSSSGHTSSLSPSPRATQSPPKQTLFSPCVDIFEPGPPSWEEGEEDQEVGENEDDEEEDMGADESQYRHRRLTGDSGIEVCRCRVEEEDEEDEEEEEVEEKEDDRRGGVAERDKKGSGNTDLHDSVDCPARGQITTGEGLTLCNPTSTTTPTSEESAEVVIVMERV